MSNREQKSTNLFLVVFCWGLVWLGRGSSVYALPYGCQVMPAKAVSVVDQLIKGFYNRNEQDSSADPSLPSNLPLNTNIDSVVDVNTGKSTQQIQYESVLRPKKSENFQLLNLILFKLERTRHLMYVCFNLNSLKPEESHLTIYFILAYGLEPNSFDRDNLSTAPGDWLFGPGGLLHSRNDSVAQITRIPVELSPLSALTDGVDNLTDNIPIFEEVFKIPGSLIKFSGVLLARANEKLGAGVERIEVTSKYIEFANKVDLDHPEKAHILYRLDLAEKGLTTF